MNELSATKISYKRVLLKISGEALMGNRQYGIDPDRLNELLRKFKQFTKWAFKYVW